MGKRSEVLVGLLPGDGPFQRFQIVGKSDVGPLRKKPAKNGSAALGGIGRKPSLRMQLLENGNLAREEPPAEKLVGCPFHRLAEA